MEHRDSGTVSTVEYEVRGCAAWLTLNRPSALNGLTPALLTAFSAALRRAAHDDAVRCVVVTGAGRAFCAGVDLSYAQGLGQRVDRAFEDFVQPFAALVASLEAIPKPLIAAVNGTCVGGGLEIMLACDMTIAAEDALIGDGHVVYGLLPVTGIARKLIRTIGSARAHRMLMTGALYPAAEIVSMGLANKIVPAEHLVSEVGELATLLGRRSSSTLCHLKAMLRLEPDLSREAAAGFELSRAREHFASGVPQCGIRAFAEGREPDFDSTE